MDNYKYKPHDPKVGRTRIIIWGSLIGIIILVVWAYFALIPVIDWIEKKANNLASEKGE